MAYDRIEGTIMLHRRTRSGSTTKYIRTQEDLSRADWFIKNVWKARFKWDPYALNPDGSRGRIVEVK